LRLDGFEMKRFRIVPGFVNDKLINGGDSGMSWLRGREPDRQTISDQCCVGIDHHILDSANFLASHHEWPDL
jgi:hypothetical protein